MSALAGVRRLLAVRVDNAGDIVLLGPALRALKQHLPDARLTLLCTSAGAQAAPLLPWIDDQVVTRPIWQEIGHARFDPGADRVLIARLAAMDFDAALIFTSFSQSPHAAAAACALAGIPVRAGSSREAGGEALTHPVAPSAHEQHEAERDLRLVEGLGVPVADHGLSVVFPEEGAAAPGAAAPGVAPAAAPGAGGSDPYLVVSPWASCPARTYPPDRMLEAAARLALAGGWHACMTGRPGERDRVHALLGRLPAKLAAPVIDDVGSTTVPELARLIAGARLVLTNNTLAMHLADAARVPIVATYSGTDLPVHWAPRDAPAALLRKSVPCSPCHLSDCPDRQRCLDMPVEKVVRTARALLDKAARS